MTEHRNHLDQPIGFPLPGIVAQQSALKGGELLKSPQYAPLPTASLKS